MASIVTLTASAWKYIAAGFLLGFDVKIIAGHVFTIIRLL